MNTILTSDRLLVVRNGDAEKWLDLLKEALAADGIVPYLGPDLLRLQSARPPVPHTPEAVATALNTRTPAPSRIRSNMWSVAQFIEQRRHRRTLQTWMAEIFGAPVAPTALHAWLATLPLSLIVDGWYDGTMRAAFAKTGRTDVVEIQGVTRANGVGDIWTKTTICPGMKSNARQRQRRSSIRRTAVFGQPQTSSCPIPIMSRFSPKSISRRRSLKW